MTSELIQEADLRIRMITLERSDSHVYDEPYRKILPNAPRSPRSSRRSNPHTQYPNPGSSLSLSKTLSQTARSSGSGIVNRQFSLGLIRRHHAPTISENCATCRHHAR